MRPDPAPEGTWGCPDHYFPYAYTCGECAYAEAMGWTGSASDLPADHPVRLARPRVTGNYPPLRVVEARP